MAIVGDFLPTIRSKSCDFSGDLKNSYSISKFCQISQIDIFFGHWSLNTHVMLRYSVSNSQILQMDMILPVKNYKKC